MTIKLIHNKGFKWFSNENTYFKGYIIVENICYSGAKALQLIENKRSAIELKNLLFKTSGLFTIIIKTNTETIVATDIMSTFPIFWEENGGLITDNPYEFIANELHQDSINQFQLTSHTCYDSTLLKEVVQTESLQIVEFTKEAVKKSSYFEYNTFDVSKKNEQQLQIELSSIIKTVFKNLVDSSNNRTLVVPLSGGYDSRLIVVQLKELGYQNVICFTFGISDNEEELISKKVAEKLGYQWFFVDYNKINIDNYLNTPQFRNYVEFTSKLSTFPYLQEYFAVDYIKKNNLVPDDAIFIPGHSGDGIAGSQLKNKFNYNNHRKKILKELLNNFHNVSDTSISDNNLKNLSTWINNKKGYAASIYEEWIFKERIAKCVANSSSVFDFFGYEYRLPFWDLRLVEFFKQVPLELKNYKILYDKVLKNVFFAPYDLNFHKELQPTPKEINRQNIKDKVKRVLPKAIMNKMKDPVSWSAYDKLTKPMLEELKTSPFKENIGRSNNSIIVNWYLDQLRKDRI